MALRGENDPYGPLGAAPFSQPTAEDELAQIFGIDPNYQEPAEETFAPSGYERFLEQFAGGLQGVEAPRPRNFLEGLLVGTTSGLGSAGSRVAKARSRFEEKQRERNKQTDAQRLEATKRYKEAKAQEYLARTKDERAAALKKPEPTSEERIKTIEAEAEARARGTRRGAPLKEEEDISLNLSPEGLDAAALSFARTGQMVPMGMGKSGVKTRERIINRAAQLMPGLDIASNKASFDASKSALGNLKKIHSSSKAFEQTALKNLAVLEETMKKIPNTDSPLLNRPLRAINRAALGSAELAAFDAARQTVVPEFARLLNSPTASGQLSDTAREEIQHIVSGDYSLKQLKSALDILKRDAKNRTESYEEAIRTTEQEISGIGRGSAQSRVSVPAGAKKGGFFEANAPGAR